MICVEHYYFRAVFIIVSGQRMRKGTQGFEFVHYPSKKLRAQLCYKHQILGRSLFKKTSFTSTIETFILAAFITVVECD
jgi:hypothetical protein